jgi:hypothetical protein
MPSVLDMLGAGGTWRRKKLHGSENTRCMHRQSVAGQVALPIVLRFQTRQRWGLQIWLFQLLMADFSGQIHASGLPCHFPGHGVMDLRHMQRRRAHEPSWRPADTQSLSRSGCQKKNLFPSRKAHRHDYFFRIFGVHVWRLHTSDGKFYLALRLRLQASGMGLFYMHVNVKAIYQRTL